MVLRCTSCGAELKTKKEKLTRTCDVCARAAHQGFQEMSQGKFKQGFQRVMDVKFARDPKRQDAVKDKMQAAMRKKRKKIRRNLEKKVKKGELSREQMEEGLRQFDDNLQGGDDNGNQ